MSRVLLNYSGLLVWKLICPKTGGSSIWRTEYWGGFNVSLRRMPFERSRWRLSPTAAIALFRRVSASRKPMGFSASAAARAFLMLNGVLTSWLTSPSSAFCNPARFSLMSFLLRVSVLFVRWSILAVSRSVSVMESFLFSLCQRSGDILRNFVRQYRAGRLRCCLIFYCHKVITLYSNYEQIDYYCQSLLPGLEWIFFRYWAAMFAASFGNLTFLIATLSAPIFSLPTVVSPHCIPHIHPALASWSCTPFPCTAFSWAPFYFCPYFFFALYSRNVRRIAWSL